jgi:hypothetical protein
MTNPTALLRSFIILSICLPLAILLGYIIAGPFDYTFVGVVGACIFVLLLPLLLSYHYPLMLLGWNATMIVFFLPGAPQVWLPLVAFSITISIVRRTIDPRSKFISVPSVTWPLVVIAVVVVATAEATGGIKLRSMGGQVAGGKRYILLLAAIVGYFALTAQQIPRERAGRYIGLFLLGGLTVVMGDVLYFESRALQFVFWFFPPNLSALETQTGMVRLSGVGAVASVITYFMLAKYGIQGIFFPRRPWRLALFLFCVLGSLAGGFRSGLIGFLLVFWMMFYLEGLQRTKLLPVLLLAGTLAASLMLPLVEKLPYNFQRALSFLPVSVSQVARADAEESAHWRLEIWKAVLPEVPHYLFLGKGLAMTREDLDYSREQEMHAMRAFTQEESWAALAGDYHSGPLSIIIPFGIWGVLAFLWFVVAAVRVVYKNYRYGDPDLRTINAFLLATLIARLIMYFVIVGAFFVDLQAFVAYVGLSVALNGGVARPVPAAVPDAAKETGFVNLLPRRRSAFGR